MIMAAVFNEERLSEGVKYVHWTNGIVVPEDALQVSTFILKVKFKT